MMDLHIHSSYCDGKNTPRELVLAAIKKGMDTVGICAHSYTFFDESWCMKKHASADFKKEMSSLKKEFASKIRVLCGIEQDLYSEEATDGYDYVIGSVHYIKKGREYLPIDESADILKDIAKHCFNDSFIQLSEAYYSAVSCLDKSCDIIGHFDIITKFNENNALFSENDERYIRAYKNAANRLSLLKIPFEVNTGAISRGYRTEPYPSEAILRYLKQLGSEVILSSDSHNTENLCFGFEKEKKRLKSLGFSL